MADEEKKGLDELFSEYKQRKQKGRLNREIKQSEKQALLDEKLELIDNTIMPILENYKMKCEANGHHVEITENRRTPKVEFSFMPMDVPITSEITFIYSDAGKINIEGRIYSDEGSQSVYKYGVERLQDVEKVTKQWVETQLLRFIKAVLEAS